MNCHYLSLKMFNFVRGPQRLVYVCNILINKSQKLANTVRPFSLFVHNSSRNRLCSALQNNGVLVSVGNNQSMLYISRNKHKSAKANYRKNVDNDSSDDEDELEDEDDDDDDDDDFADKNLKTYKVQSMRIDLLLKSFLKMSRRKIENSFYENKIRINGHMALKKSQNAKKGDEIDLIIGLDGSSSDFLNIKRVVIYEVKYDEDSDRFHVKGECFNSLKVENYSGRAAWKEAEEQN